MQEALVVGTSAGPTRQVRLADKRTVKLPCLIQKQVSMTALFRAPTSEAKKVLPTKKLRLIEVVPGTTLVGFACMEYREVEGLPDYTEVGVFVPVRYAPRFELPLVPLLAPKLFPDAGYYFHRMVVSSPEAFELGVSIHGLRKSLGEVLFDDLPFARKCTAKIDGQILFELEVQRSATRFTNMTTQTYTMHGSHVLRTPVPTRGQIGLSRAPKAAKLTLGTHFIADELRALELSPTPTFTMWGPEIQSVLAAPARTLQP
jgi:hypothetical protein